MKTTLFTPYLSDHAIKAICWTLIHSLWIGVIAAALAGTVIAFTKNASANLRYRLLCGVLVLFVVATAFTLYSELETGTSTTTVINLSNDATGQTIITTTNAAVSINGFSYTRAVDVFNQYSAWIFAAWLICFAFKTFKLSRELLYIKRVRSVGVLAVADEWKNKVRTYGKKLGIQRAVDILESKLINVPVTIGYLKPVILLPAGMLLQLSPAQIESIIYHELAHILRRDYLVNIMQSLVETVFFFNPAIWWISALIREEREVCCDDIVLAHVPHKRNYLEALMAFQDYEPAAGSYAMGLSLRKHQLMNRLRRMVSHENQKLNIAEKVVLLSGMVLLLVFTVVPKANSEVRHGARFIKNQMMAMVGGNTPHVLPPPRLPAKKSSPPSKLRIDTLKRAATMRQLTDTLPKLVRVQFNKTNADSLNREMVLTDDAGNNYYIKTVNKKVVAFTINDVVIPENEFSHYQPLFNRMDQMLAKASADKARNGYDRKEKLMDERSRDLADLKAGRDAKNEHIRATRNTDSLKRASKQQVVKTRRDASKAGDQNSETVEMERKIERQVEREAQMATKDKERYVKEKARDDIDKAKHDDGWVKTYENNGDNMELRNEKDGSVMVLRDKAGNTLNLTSKATRDEPKPKSGDIVPAIKKRHYADISADQQRVRGVLAALVNEKAVGDASSVDWFGLSNDELIVNGTKQPEALHQKLKEQYGIKPNNGLYYGPVKMNGTGVFLDKKDL